MNNQGKYCKKYSKLIFILFISILFISCSKSIVPDDFEIPIRLETSNFIIRPITVLDAEKDYEAVMESIDIIHKALLSNAWLGKIFQLCRTKENFRKKKAGLKAKVISHTPFLILMKAKYFGVFISTKVSVVLTQQYLGG